MLSNGDGRGILKKVHDLQRVTMDDIGIELFVHPFISNIIQRICSHDVNGALDSLKKETIVFRMP